MSVTGGILAGIGVAGSLGGAAISSNAANNAANTQSSAADYAANLQYQASQNALGFQEQEYNQNEQNLQPWLQSGTGALSNLDYLLGVGPQTSQQFSGATGATAAAPNSLVAAPSTQPGSGISAGNVQSMAQTPGQSTLATAPGIGPSGVIPGPTSTIGATPTGVSLNGGSPSATNPQAGAGGAVPAGAASAGGYGSLLAAYPGGQFQAPTAAQAEQYPGEQFMLQQGTQALQGSAAANGSLLTGGTAKALDAYGQGLASTDYQNVYNDAYNTYSSNYNQYENQQTNEYNRLASLAGVGQTAASQLGTLGANAASGISSNLLGTASAMGQDYQNAAAANASGYVGSANAYAGALGSSSNSISNLLLLSQLQNQANPNPSGTAYDIG